MLNILDIIPSTTVPTYMEWVKFQPEDEFVSEGTKWIAENKEFLTRLYDMFLDDMLSAGTNIQDYDSFAFMQFIIVSYNQEQRKIKQDIEAMCKPFAGILGNQFGLQK